MKNKIIYILPLLIIFLVSCNTGTENNTLNNDVVYFGGNIINPVSKEVKLVKTDGKTDTLIAKLDKNNFFIFKIDSLKTGAYTFHHGEEFQYVYLEKHDSLMIRLNTLEFDESLVFTGKGAPVNNYLIKRYVNNENNNINLIHLFSLDTAKFNKTIDSIKVVESQILSDFNYNESGFSEEALRWANNMLKFTEYSIKELYPYNNTLINKRDSLTRVDSSFFDYRKDVDINDSTLYNNEYFKSYLNSRIVNLTLDSLFTVIPEKDFFADSKKFNKEYGNILTYYISTFKNKNIREYLYYRYSKSLFVDELSVDDLQSLLIPFYENVSDEKMINKINHLLSRYVKLSPGSKALDFDVYDGKKLKKFSEYFGKPIYLFFWLSPNRYNWNTDLTKSYNKLKKQYPTIQFISVYLDYPETWEENKKLSGANGIQLSADYRIIKNKYLIPSSNSFVLIDKNGNIVESNTSWPGGRKIKAKLDKLK